MRSRFFHLGVVTIVLFVGFVFVGGAIAEELIRVGVPTKAYFPTVQAKAAIDRKLFEKEGLRCELTVYRGGGEAFEAIAAGSADISQVSAHLVAIARNRGVLSRLVGAGADEWAGWILAVRADSKVQSVKELDGAKVGITSAGSATDGLALWTANQYKISLSRIAVGGGGLIPNLKSGNLDAAVIYSPLSYQVVKEKSVRVLVDFSKVMPPNLIGGWAVSEKLLKEKPQFVLKGLNALYGGMEYLMANRDYAIKLIAENNELSMEVARLEYEGTFPKLSRDGKMTLETVKAALEFAKLTGAKDLAPANEVFQNLNITPTKP
jgi:NitT/TauT family transport system substrate-binding protein